MIRAVVLSLHHHYGVQRVLGFRFGYEGLRGTRSSWSRRAPGRNVLASLGERDASGNVRLADIGVFLRERIQEDCRRRGRDVGLEYIDPSYTIRSTPANARDAAFCLLLAHDAVHAGMSGRTDMVLGFWKNEFTHVPIALAVSERKQIDPAGRLWNHLLASTGQPRAM